MHDLRSMYRADTRRYNFRMKLSARNQLAGTIEEVHLGNVMAHITIRVGQNLIESVITRRSAEEMQLTKGDRVRAVIKSTEVMGAERLSAPHQPDLEAEPSLACCSLTSAKRPNKKRPDESSGRRKSSSSTV